MAAVTQQWCASFEWRDAKGQTRKITICYQTGDTLGSVASQHLINSVFNTVTALQALSNAHVQSMYNVENPGTAQTGVTYGTTGEYQSVSQQARLYYLTADPDGDPTNVATITVPAPKSSIFLADAITVDPSNTLIGNLNTALNVGVSNATAGVACTRGGLVFASFVGGVFIGKKLSRKWTKYTKDPTLTIAGI